MSGFAPYNKKKRTGKTARSGLILLEQAVKFQRIGEISKAEQLYLRAIRDGVYHEKVFSNLGLIYKNTSRQSLAEEAYMRAIKINPGFSDGYTNLGCLFKEQGKLDQAFTVTLKAIELEPNHFYAYLSLGDILKEQGKLDQALAATFKAIELKDDHPDAYTNLGAILKEQGKLDQALAATVKAVEFKPDSAKSHYGLGIVKRMLGDLNGGTECLRKALELNPLEAGALYELSTSLESPNQALQLIEHSKSFREEFMLPRDKSMLYFALSNCYHKLNDYMTASHYLQHANQVKLSLNPSDGAQRLKHISAILAKASLSPSLCSKAGEKMIFIVGLPRCGSTLLDSILSMHANAISLGELPAMASAIAQAEYSHELGLQLSLEDLYLERLNVDLQSYSFIIDKQLHNFAFAGILAANLPAAKIIDCRRHPMDHILSMYKSNLTAGNNYTSDLVDAASMLVAKEKVMQEYARRFPKQIYAFNYDRLVTSPKAALQPLLDWLHIDWDDKFLHPEENARPVNTASVIQARNPISRSSIGGWLNYRQLLQPAEEIIERSGIFPDLLSHY